jgi:OOP family OmpA-OmpF porin
MKILFSISFTVLALFSNAQFIKKLSLDLNVGGRFGGAVSDSLNGGDKAKVSPGIHVNGGVSYQLSELISLRGGISYDVFTTSLGSDSDNSSLMSASIEAVINLKKLKFLELKNEKICLNLHGGFVLSSLSNTKFKEGKEFSDPGIKGNDDMINIIFGLTPQYKLTDKISINLDLSSKLLVKQSLYVNASHDSSVNDKMGNIFNVAVGATYKF